MCIRDSFSPPPASQSLGINYICASSYATCVGGTEFNDVPEATYWNETATEAPPFLSALGPIPEGAWNEPLDGSDQPQIAGGGGGVSIFNTPTPSWQTGTGVPTARAGRYVPDVAFSSAAHDGYFGCLAGGGGDCVVSGGTFNFISFSGTSAAAPSMAGITALLNQQETSAQGWLNQELYTLAATPTNLVFNDVTVTTSGVSGCVVTTPSMCNNSTASPTGLTGGLAGYLVTAGYDEATGWGSIDVGNLLTSWANTNLAATTTALVSSLNPAIFGAAVTLTATVTTAGTTAPTGTVTFKNGTSAVGTGTLATVGGSQVATLTSSTLPVGSDSITAVYGGDANNGGSTSNTVTQVITAPAFAFTAQPSTPVPAAAGLTTTSTFTITPTGTTTLPITFACNGLPDATITCSATPIPAGSTGLQTVTLSITTSGPNTSSESNRHRRRADNRSPWLPLTFPLAGIVMVGLAGRKISRYSAIAGLCVSLLLLGLLLACGSSTPPVAISVSPAGATVWASEPTWPPQTATFTATVSNTSNTAVNWTVTTTNGGSITSAGVYTSPTAAAGLPTSATIMATSQADTTKTATATVTLTPTSVPGTYPLTVTATEGQPPNGTSNTSSSFNLTVQ